MEESDIIGLVCANKDVDRRGGLADDRELRLRPDLPRLAVIIGARKSQESRKAKVFEKPQFKTKINHFGD